MRKFLLAMFLFVFASVSHAENCLELRIPCNVGENVTAILPSQEVIMSDRVLML